MPFDPLNPFQTDDPFRIANTQLGISPAERRVAQQPTLPPLSPEDEKTLLEKIGNTLGGGLGFVGGILEKPGRIVRGLLAGKPRELLNAVPFSDSLGLTRPEDRTTGADLLGTQDDPFLSAGGLGGLAVDIATDPLTYLSFGGSALTKAGLAAKKAGTLPATIAERTAQGLGGHIGVGLPFAGNAATFNLAPLGNAIKSGVQTVANVIPGGNAILEAGGKIGGALGDLYSSTIPPLFQKAVMGQTNPEAQAVAREVSEAIPGVQAAARQRVQGLTDLLPDVTQEGGRNLRQQLETKIGPATPVVAGQRSYQDELLSRLNQHGQPDLPLADEAVAFAPRQATVMNRSEQRALESSLRPAGQLPAREQILKGLPTEGKGSINDLTRREDLLPLRQDYTAGNKAPLEQVVKKQYLGVDDAELSALQAKAKSGPLAAADMDRLSTLEAGAKQAENLANWVATSVPEDLAKNGLGFFDRHPHLDLVDKAVRDETRILKTEGLHKAIAKMAEADPAGAPLSQVLERAGLTFKDASGQSTAMARTLEALQAEGKLPASATLKDLEGLTVPVDQVNKLARFTQAATSPAGLKPILDLFDSVTNLTKGWQTAIWPANWARNQGQAMFQNWVHDAYNAQHSGPMAYVKPFLDAKSWRNGGVIEGASKYPGFEHLSEEAASNALHKEIAALNVPGGFSHAGAELAGGDIAVKRLFPEVPGEARTPFTDILKSYVPKSKAEANPLGVAGVGENLADTFAPIKAGRQINQELDAVNRVSTYLAKRSQGFSPEAALREVKEAHFDFTNLSGFEKDVMKRVVPFYSWARNNIPNVVSEIATNPGGKLATAVKASQAAKGEHPGFVRPDIAQGLALPIGQEENGQQRYLSGLGLGFEDLGRLLGPGGVVGQLNPLIKYPLEQITGRQANTGRDMRDIHSRLADLGINAPGAVENAILNSPVGRIETSLGTLFDSRKSPLDKAVNLLTGARFSDIDQEQARRNAVRDYILEAMHGPGISQYSDFSVRPENIPLLTPEQQSLFQLHRLLQSRRPLPALP